MKRTLELFLILPVLWVWCAMAPPVPPAPEHLLRKETLFGPLIDKLKQALLWIGSILCAVSTLEGLRQLLQNATVIGYGRAEPTVKRLGWWPRVGLLIGAVCLGLWGVMSAVSAVVQLLFFAVAGVGLFLVLRYKRRELRERVVDMAVDGITA